MTKKEWTAQEEKRRGDKRQRRRGSDPRRQGHVHRSGDGDHLRVGGVAVIGRGDGVGVVDVRGGGAVEAATGVVPDAEHRSLHSRIPKVTRGEASALVGSGQSDLAISHRFEKQLGRTGESSKGVVKRSSSNSSKGLLIKNGR